MHRISNTWELAKTSWAVLKKDREMLWITVMSWLASLVVIAIVVLVVTAVVATDSNPSGQSSLNAAQVIVGLFGIFMITIITVFFNGALVAGAHERLSGGDPTVGSAVGRAFQRLGGLVPWAILTATVGLVLQALRNAMRERFGFLGDMVARLIGAAWEVTVFLVIPAIVVGNRGAIDGLKESASLLRQTWGENLIARMGFGLLGFVLLLPAVLVGVVIALSGVTILIWVGIIVLVLYGLVVAVVLATLNAIFQTALYMYATTGTVPADFESTPLARSFSQR